MKQPISSVSKIPIRSGVRSAVGKACRLVIGEKRIERRKYFDQTVARPAVSSYHCAADSHDMPPIGTDKSPCGQLRVARDPFATWHGGAVRCTALTGNISKRRLSWGFAVNHPPNAELVRDHAERFRPVGL